MKKGQITVTESYFRFSSNVCVLVCYQNFAHARAVFLRTWQVDNNREGHKAHYVPQVACLPDSFLLATTCI